jgi:hypothetical protein
MRPVSSIFFAISGPHAELCAVVSQYDVDLVRYGADQVVQKFFGNRAA